MDGGGWSDAVSVQEVCIAGETRIAQRRDRRAAVQFSQQRRKELKGLTMESAFNAPGHWYGGNLHTHTTFSDGNKRPEEAVAWWGRQTAWSIGQKV